MANITKHTPGPWEIVGEPVDYRIENKSRVVALVQWYPLVIGGITSSQVRANADLIAAAPELLAYVKAVEFAIRLSGSQGKRGSIYTDAVALIKLCGDQPLSPDKNNELP